MRRFALLIPIVLFALPSLFPAASMAISSRTLISPTGVASFDDFGTSVASAGDVNGDGYPDVIVGSIRGDVGGTDVGDAFIYFGGPHMDATPDLTLTGAVDNFGISVAAAGDVNGDGYDDIIVGANLSASTGKAYVYFGGPSLDTNPDWILTGAAAGDGFGFSVGTAGDVNGDGFADVIIGAPGSDAGGTDAGRAYVFYGGTTPNAVADLTLTGAAINDQFGFSAGAAGDVNGDGYADVIVGAWRNGAGGVMAGRAYVFLGGASPNSVADVTMTGAASAQLGVSVATAGDVNGDGFSDVIVGANAGAVGISHAFVYFGGPAMDAGADRTLNGITSGDDFGYSVGSAGDVNGDGYADVIVGADFSCRAYIFLGGQTADAVEDLALTGAALGDFFGQTVAGAGDLDGDGYADVVVGAYSNDANGIPDAGRAYVTSIFPFKVLAPNGGEQWVTGQPATVRWMGHDQADIAVSTDGGATYNVVMGGVGGADQNEVTFLAPDPPTSLARVRVSQTGQPVQHGTSDTSDKVFKIVAPTRAPSAAARVALSPTGAAPNDQFGTSVSTAGDVNGDGYPDIIVGAPRNDAAAADAGRAYIYFGGPGADAVADVTLTGATLGDYFGAAVGNAGDVNGDGFDDVVVGAPQNDGPGTDVGKAYVYFGGPSMDSVADLTLSGELSGDLFGSVVSTAGDVNGDGFSDVIVGAFSCDKGFTNAGRAYVFYGGPAADAIPDLVFTGGASGDFLGTSAGTAGDVNGDGFADVIVGAYGNSAGGALAGRAFVYYGGPGADNKADLTFTGEAAGDFFGATSGTAGDVNGDGYADVIVGAYAQGSFAGRAYVFFGGPNADAIPDLTLNNSVAGDALGGALGTAGDVNGDGYADVIVGAFGANGSAGKTYIYYGGPAPDAKADLVFTGAAANDYLGVSVGAAGDVTGDGFADVIIGSFLNDFGGADAGRAYVYDCNRYVLLAPNGGETWNVGAIKTISWQGAERADLWLTTDGGDPRLGQRLAANVGGEAENAVSVRVPHTPTKFARIVAIPADPALRGSDRSDSLFTIQTSVSLLALLAAPLPQGGALVSWNTDPGPADLSGYRLESSEAASSAWRTLVALTRDVSVTDPNGGPGTRYRLFAVNGFGEELLLGETSIRPLAPLTAWPLPFRGGSLTIAFAAAGGLGTGGAKTEVAVFDLQGRLVRRIANGSYSQGYHAASWDGRDAGGRRVASGIYFLRATSGGDERTIRLSVLR